jgi:formylglycine-generating enzyme required for sulfatase activity
MVFVQGGSFKMGSNDGDSDEKPVHSVTVDDFYIGKYEVTQKEWNDVMGNNPSHRKGYNLPVESVSWYDAVEFCNKKSRAEGLTPCYSGSGTNTTCNFSANGYRLPTEAEWEYAARGGVKTHDRASLTYAGSNSIKKVAWYRGNSESKTHPVGKKQANELGLHDMSGNVWEWCNDWYDENYYSSSIRYDPQGAVLGSRRALRGGSWYDLANLCRVANRKKPRS